MQTLYIERSSPHSSHTTETPETPDITHVVTLLSTSLSSKYSREYAGYIQVVDQYIFQCTQIYKAVDNTPDKTLTSEQTDFLFFLLRLTILEIPIHSGSNLEIDNRLRCATSIVMDTHFDLKRKALLLDNIFHERKRLIN